jgi:ABC-type transport system substrate-binding protein
MTSYVRRAGRGLIVLLLVGFTLVAPGKIPAQAGTAHSPSYGGALVGTTGSDIEDLDPAISYNWADFNMLHDVFEGLLGYKPGSTQLVPVLAARMPTISTNGLVYTFTLRQGVRFQAPVNRDVTAADFKYSWQRVLNPKTASPGASFLFDIVGAQAYYQGKTKDVPGIQVLGPYSLQIHLVKSEAFFKYIPAITFTYVVPHETVDQYPKDFSHHAVGTGPFMLKTWVRDQYVEFVRNPNYWQKGLPYLDSVTLKVVPQPTVAVEQIERGEADVFTDPTIPPLDYLQLKGNSRWHNQLVSTPILTTNYLWLNTAVSPLNNRLVRQAIAMTIDKKRIIAVATGGLAQPTGVILPPSMPCYDPNLRTWSYDPVRARQLLAQAGYPHGFSTSILASHTAVSQAAVEQIIQSDLAQIGINATIKLATGSTYQTLERSKANQMGQTGWGADYPDPSDFIDTILTGSGVGPGGSNFAWYSNPAVNALAAQADGTLNQSMRCNLYHRVEQLIINDAPWVPLYTPDDVTLISPRVTKFWINPSYGAFDFAYYQVSK